MNRFAALMVAACLGALPAAAQEDPHAACASVGWVPREVLDRPVPVRTGIGRAHETLPGASAQVQALHDQGLAYLHSYVWIEAARSFRQALRADPGQALTWVALSRTFTGLNDEEAARKSQREAERLAARAARVSSASPRGRATWRRWPTSPTRSSTAPTGGRSTTRWPRSRRTSSCCCCGATPRKRPRRAAASGGTRGRPGTTGRCSRSPRTTSRRTTT